MIRLSDNGGGRANNLQFLYWLNILFSCLGSKKPSSFENGFVSTYFYATE